MSDLIRKFVKSQMEGAVNVDDTHLNTPQPDRPTGPWTQKDDECLNSISKIIEDHDRLTALTRELREALQREHLNQCDHVAEESPDCTVCALLQRSKGA